MSTEKPLTSFELLQVRNGGWVLTDRAGRATDGRGYLEIPATYAYSSTDDMMNGLAKMLHPGGPDWDPTWRPKKDPLAEDGVFVKDGAITPEGEKLLASFKRHSSTWRPDVDA